MIDNKSYHILAFDVGNKRIGVARAKSSVRLVDSLEVVDVDNHKRLLELIDLYQPAILVVGLPYNEKGELSEQAHKIKTWITNFMKIYNLKFKFVSTIFN